MLVKYAQLYIELFKAFGYFLCTNRNKSSDMGECLNLGVHHGFSAKVEIEIGMTCNLVVNRLHFIGLAIWNST